ncbi:pilus assembly protein [Oricola cellulosilytica]|uniref:Pilus assembly protein n=2 Tax=Oricola cellulosilytica TaxID=1429082 RepID=A0A4R0PJG2_9HYPH|nr:pilus assembly protein [Oricola cellulosilytica]
MVEAIVVVPFIFLFSVGILTFGFVMLEREQVITGLRDATRYLARCNATIGCSEEIAKNIAFYGNPAGTGALRVLDWGDDLGDISFTYPGNTCASATIPMPPDCAPTIEGYTSHQLPLTPLYGALEIGAITVTETHQQRNIGW